MLSVVIPVYNGGQYLTELLNSVVKQTYKNLEIICVDDGSTDDTSDILAQYQKNYPNIKIATQKNQGAGTARNTGLDIASGDYISILDADDILDESMFEKMLESASPNNSDIVICRSKGFDEKNPDINIDYSLKKNCIHPEKEVFNYKDLGNRVFNFCVGWTWDKIFKLSFIRENNIRFQEIRRADDLFFTFFAIANARRISLAYEYLIYHRYHPGQMSTTRQEALYDFFLAIEHFYNSLVEKDLYETLKPSFVYWCSKYCVWQYNSMTGQEKKLLRDFLRETVFPQFDFLSEEYIDLCDKKALITIRDIWGGHGKKYYFLHLSQLIMKLKNRLIRAWNMLVNKN